jgi:polyhydroxybutyrate depolymerase
MIQSARSFAATLIAGTILAGTLATSAGHAATAGVRTGDSQGSMIYGGLTRTYVLHVPASYTGTRAVPLVLVLHGGSGTGGGQERISHMDATADRHGFIAVFPDGYGRVWNDERGVTSAQQAGIDDVGFLTALISRREVRLKINRRMVYATGLSNGGFMSQRLGCHRAGVIAAIASVAATMPAAPFPPCKPERPLPVMYIQGTQDPLVPYIGGTVNGNRGQVLSAADTIRTWVSIDGCTGLPSRSFVPKRAADGTVTGILSYTTCAGHSAVELYTVIGGGHTWPGGEQYLPVSMGGQTSRDFDASETIWRFFRSHVRP